MILRRELLALLPLASPTRAQQHAMDVVRGDPDRRLLLDAIRPTLARLTDGPVQFGVRELRRFGEFAFGVLQPHRPERQPIDWAGTRARDRLQDPNFREGLTFVLWRRLAGGWKVEEYAVGAPDTVWMSWRQRFALPQVMFEQGTMP
jgi:hypothetical protein